MEKWRQEGFNWRTITEDDLRSVKISNSSCEDCHEVIWCKSNTILGHHDHISKETRERSVRHQCFIIRWRDVENNIWVWEAKKVNKEKKLSENKTNRISSYQNASTKIFECPLTDSAHINEFTKKVTGHREYFSENQLRKQSLAWHAIDHMETAQRSDVFVHHKLRHECTLHSSCNAMRSYLKTFASAGRIWNDFDRISFKKTQVLLTFCDHVRLD